MPQNYENKIACVRYIVKKNLAFATFYTSGVRGKIPVGHPSGGLGLVNLTHPRGENSSE